MAKIKTKKEIFREQFKDYNLLIIVVSICAYVIAFLYGSNEGSGSCSPICNWNLLPLILAWSIASLVILILEIVCFIKLAKDFSRKDKKKLLRYNLVVLLIICVLYLAVFRVLSLLVFFGSGIVNLGIFLTSDIFILSRGRI